MLHTSSSTHSWFITQTSYNKCCAITNVVLTFEDIFPCSKKFTTRRNYLGQLLEHICCLLLRHKLCRTGQDFMYCMQLNFHDTRFLQICHLGHIWHLIEVYFHIGEILSCQPVFRTSKSDHY